MGCLLFIDTPEESGIGVVSSMHEEQCSSKKVTFAQAIGLCMPIVSWVLVHSWLTMFLQTNDNHKHGDLNHYFIIFYLFENLEQF